MLNSVAVAPVSCVAEGEAGDVHEAGGVPLLTSLCGVELACCGGAEDAGVGGA
jgi:hypothetical protein